MTENPVRTKTRLLVATLSLPVTLIVAFSLSPTLVQSIRDGLSPDTTWRGEYYANMELRGLPARIAETGVITFDWGEERPFPELPPDHFSARWTCTDVFEARTYIFAVRSYGGTRVYIDDELIIDNWAPGYCDWSAVERQITAGRHRVRVEYFDDGGIAYIQAGYYPAEN